MNEDEKAVDELLEDIQEKVESVYSRALRESRKKADKYFNGYARRDAQKKKERDSGDISDKDYKKWREGQMLTGQRYNEMVDVIAKDLTNADKIASSIIGDHMPDAYAIGHNYSTFEVEKESSLNTSYTLYNRQTVERLIRDGDVQLKPPSPDIPKDERWNRQHINAELTQAVLQGDSVKEVSGRLQNVTNMDKAAAMRNARTAMTATQNVGKLDGYKRLSDMGLKVRKRWIASHDSLTRDTHIEVDEEVVGLDEEFSNGLQFPGDPNGPAEEVYNCRCTMESVLDDFDLGDDKPEYAEYDAELPDMSYEEWAKSRAGTGSAPAPSRVVVNGVDLTNTWTRRPDKFEYEIEDIINAQGFDGLPRVVSREEFDKAVAESNFIAQRTYSAPDQETLDSYRDMLYNGKWYVDCSNGGSVYGQGMYCSSDYSTQISDRTKREMTDYYRLGSRKIGGDEPATVQTQNDIIESYIKSKGLTGDKAEATRIYLKSQSGIERPDRQGVELVKSVLGRDGMSGLRQEAELVKNAYENSRSYIETFTMSSDAKIITYNDLASLMHERIDPGVFAARLGYDGVYVESSGYTVVLNRTKCIFLGE